MHLGEKMSSRILVSIIFFKYNVYFCKKNLYFYFLVESMIISSAIVSCGCCLHCYLSLWGHSLNVISYHKPHAISMTEIVQSTICVPFSHCLKHSVLSFDGPISKVTPDILFFHNLLTILNKMWCCYPFILFHWTSL